MLRHIKNILYTLVLSTAIIGCRKDGVVPQEGNSYTFRLSLPQNRVPEASTYSMSTADENKADTIEVLSFVETSANHFEYARHYSVPTIHQNQTQIDFSINLASRTERQQFLVLINAGQAVRTARLSPGLELNSAIGQLMISNPKEWPAHNAKGQSGIRYIPMYGCSTPLVINGKAQPIDIEATRMLACISVKSSLAANQFELVDARIYNRATVGSLCFPTSLWNTNTGSVTAPFLPSSGVKKIKLPTEVYPLTAAQQIIQSIYTMENAAPGGRADATALVVGAKYNNSPDVTYYRIDIPEFDASGKAKAGSMGPLLRNHHYIIDITSASKAGAAQPNVAFDGDMNLTATITDWIPVRQDITLNTQHVLAFSTRHITLDGKNANDKKTVIISTDQDQSNPLMQLPAGAGWLTTSLKPLPDDLAGHKRYALNLSATGNTPGGPVRKTSLNIKFLNLSCTIDVDQSAFTNSVFQPKASANCYILIAGSNNGVQIPAGSHVGSASAVHAELLWTDNSNGMSPDGVVQSVNVSGSGPNAVVEVAQGKAQGNAVVVLKDAQGTILWSWHIWVLTSMPTEHTTGKGYKIMDLNLGATSTDHNNNQSHGLLYQWGRKDPFPMLINKSWSRVYDAQGTQLGTPGWTSVTEKNNLAFSIKNPYTFYVGKSSLYDWYTTATFMGQFPQDEHLWSSQSKTQYDPCPEGYHVPGDDCFTDLIAANVIDANGRVDYVDGSKGNAGEKGVIYPATDCIKEGMFIGNLLAYWTSTPGSGKAHSFMAEYPQNLHPNENIGRDSGLPVRCVRK